MRVGAMLSHKSSKCERTMRELSGTWSDREKKLGWSGSGRSGSTENGSKEWKLKK